MTLFRRIAAHPFAPLALFPALAAACWACYAKTGVDPGPAFDILASIAWCILVLLWIERDARRRGGTPCFDFGFLCYVFFPIAVPWYCLWSRGWRGVAMLAAIAGTWLLPMVIAAVLA